MKQFLVVKMVPWFYVKGLAKFLHMKNKYNSWLRLLFLYVFIFNLFLCDTSGNTACCKCL